MFLITQFIGLYVVSYYSQDEKKLPYGMESPEIEKDSDYTKLLVMIIIAFIFAIVLFFFLTKFDFSKIIRFWFFFVVALALGIFFNVFIGNWKYATIIAFAVALFLSYLKIYKRNILVHNSTELMIYPGIAAVFVPLLSIYTIFAFLIIISLYDMWAVWHSGVMQKMAKYQMNTLKVFSGFFIPYISKKQKEKIKKMSKSELNKNKVKINVAILGGGDIIFPIITAGVILNSLGIFHSLFIIFGATLGLGYLFYISEKKKFYPAMPFITGGMVLGFVLSFLFL